MQGFGVTTNLAHYFHKFKNRQFMSEIVGKYTKKAHPYGCNDVCKVGILPTSYRQVTDKVQTNEMSHPFGWLDTIKRCLTRKYVPHGRYISEGDFSPCYIHHPPQPVNHNPSFSDANARCDGEVTGM